MTLCILFVVYFSTGFKAVKIFFFLRKLPLMFIDKILKFKMVAFSNAPWVRGMLTEACPLGPKVVTSSSGDYYPKCIKTVGFFSKIEFFLS